VLVALSGRATSSKTNWYCVGEPYDVHVCPNCAWG